MGAGGIYYRTTIPSTPKNTGTTSPSLPDLSSPSPERIAAEAKLTEIESSDVSQMQDTSASGLLAEINAKQKIPSLFPLVLGGFLFASFVAANSAPIMWSILGIGAIASFFAKRQDAINKTVVVFYDFENDSEKSFKQLFDSFENLLNTQKAWHIEAAGNVKDKKRTAGADTMYKRTQIALSRSQPPFISLNLDIPCIPVGKQRIYFLPDTILIYDKRKVGAVSYKELTSNHLDTRFIETERVPSDAKVIDKTWLYVNKKGGPDKRFKDNRQLPVVQYGELHLRSASGLNERIQASNSMKLKQFADSLADYSSSFESLKEKQISLEADSLLQDDGT
jgi:hypothetical protein